MSRRLNHTIAPRKPFSDWRSAALLSFLALPLGWLAEQKYASMQNLMTADRDTLPLLPSLSIIVPARNETRNLKRLLPSLNALRYPGELEIIVVDDSSADDTGKVAQNFGARVLRVNGLPQGWHGKPHACHLGALAAQGDWLLFTDADTVHESDSAAHAVSFAYTQGLDGLALFLEHKTRNSFQGAVLMAAFAGLFAGTRQPNKLMNGQYILLRRTVYLASGGFQAVRDQPLEDLALGNLLQELGYTVLALNAAGAAAVQMYASPAQMWHGMTRLGAGSLKWSGVGALVTALFTTALASPLFVLLGVLAGRLRLAWLPLTWLAASMSVIPFARRFGSGWLALAAPFGALFVLLAAWWGLASRILGKSIPWRGRSV